MIIVYKLEITGQATNLRYESDDYVLKEHEHKYDGDTLPDINTLNTPAYNLMKAKERKCAELQGYYETQRKFPIKIIYTTSTGIVYYAATLTAVDVDFFAGIAQEPTFEELRLFFLIQGEQEGNARLKIDTANAKDIVEYIKVRDSQTFQAKWFHDLTIKELPDIDQVKAYDYTTEITPVEDGEAYKIDGSLYIVSLNDEGWNPEILEQTGGLPRILMVADTISFVNNGETFRSHLCNYHGEPFSDYGIEPNMKITIQGSKHNDLKDVSVFEISTGSYEIVMDTYDFETEPSGRMITLSTTDKQ